MGFCRGEKFGVFRISFAEFPVSAFLIHVLRLQTDVRPHGNARRREPRNCRSHFRPALDFYGFRTTLLHEAHTNFEKFGKFSVRHAERNIGGDERIRTRAGNCRRVVRHHVNRHGNGAVEPEHDVSDGIADENHVHVGGGSKPRRHGIVRRDANDLRISLRSAKCFGRSFHGLKSGKVFVNYVPICLCGKRKLGNKKLGIGNEKSESNPLLISHF